LYVATPKVRETSLSVKPDEIARFVSTRFRLLESSQLMCFSSSKDVRFNIECQIAARFSVEKCGSSHDSSAKVERCLDLYWPPLSVERSDFFRDFDTRIIKGF
jgi:hypothetical protein